MIDVACGEGWLTRHLRKAGASQVVGVDISEEMIELARWQEEREPLGIEYRVEDARTTESATGVSISQSRIGCSSMRGIAKNLAIMCHGLANRIKPGGRFVTLITNPALYTWQSHPPDYRKYGISAWLPESAYEGAPVALTVHLEDKSIVIENYYLPIEAHESALCDAGFRRRRIS